MPCEMYFNKCSEIQVIYVEEGGCYEWHCKNKHSGTQLIFTWANQNKNSKNKYGNEKQVWRSRKTQGLCSCKAIGPNRRILPKIHQVAVLVLQVLSVGMSWGARRSVSSRKERDCLFFAFFLTTCDHCAHCPLFPDYCAQCPCNGLCQTSATFFVHHRPSSWDARNAGWSTSNYLVWASGYRPWMLHYVLS